MDRINRRRCLGAIGSLTFGALAGCSSDSADGQQMPTGTPTPEPTPTPTGTPTPEPTPPEEELIAALRRQYFTDYPMAYNELRYEDGVVYMERGNSPILIPEDFEDSVNGFGYVMAHNDWSVEELRLVHDDADYWVTSEQAVSFYYGEMSLLELSEKLSDQTVDKRTSTPT